MRHTLAKFIFQTLWGWKIDSDYPKNADSSVIIVLHHTSNWDFPIGILLRPILHINTRFAAKNSLFFFPLGAIMRGLGGVAVDRSKNTNFVDACVNLYKTHPDFKLTIAPEGTRSKVTKLKSGFYYIAVKAGVPIVRCKFDWGTKTVGFSEPFYPSGDYDKDLPEILAYFKGIKGRNTEFDYEF